MTDRQSHISVFVATASSVTHSVAIIITCSVEIINHEQMGKQTMPCSRCVIYPICVFNLACAEACKPSRMLAPSRPVIFNSFNFFLIFKSCFDKYGLKF